MSARTPKIRVENLPGIEVTNYRAVTTDTTPVRPFTLLFIKPWQPAPDNKYAPPLGILTLIAGIRAHFGNAATIHFWDMKLYHDAPDALAARLDELRPDVVGVSALNYEAAASYRLADMVKAWNPDAITVIGGPFTLRQAPMIFADSQFDWIFEGAADRTLLQALRRRFSGQPLGADIAGFSHREAGGAPTYNHGQDIITDLDSLPLPAWDLVDFDRYRKHDRRSRNTSAAHIKGRYAIIFTSRGCPYLCNYCHDVFTKRFVYRSDENVLEEIRVLHEDYGVTEIFIVDDIFNLHKPHAQSLMRAIGKRWSGKIRVAFPNGLRGDILDAETIDAMVEGGTWHVCIAIETVTPRLQLLVEKNLNIEKAKWAIEEFDRRGVIVQGFLMLGFPTETPEEIQATIDYAVKSPLMHVGIAAVTPQPNTPMYALAHQESPAATTSRAADERNDDTYESAAPWYTRAYGHDLHRMISIAIIRFYLHPPRMWRLLRIYPWTSLARGAYDLLLKRVLLNIRKWLTTPTRSSATHESATPGVAPAEKPLKAGLSKGPGAA